MILFNFKEKEIYSQEIIDIIRQYKTVIDSFLDNGPSSPRGTMDDMYEMLNTYGWNLPDEWYDEQEKLLSNIPNQDLIWTEELCCKYKEKLMVEYRDSLVLNPSLQDLDYDRMSLPKKDSLQAEMRNELNVNKNPYVKMINECNMKMLSLIFMETNIMRTSNVVSKVVDVMDTSLKRFIIAMNDNDPVYISVCYVNGYNYPAIYIICDSFNSKTPVDTKLPGLAVRFVNSNQFFNEIVRIDNIEMIDSSEKEYIQNTRLFMTDTERLITRVQFLGRVDKLEIIDKEPVYSIDEINVKSGAYYTIDINLTLNGKPINGLHKTITTMKDCGCNKDSEYMNYQDAENIFIRTNVNYPRIVPMIKNTNITLSFLESNAYNIKSFKIINTETSEEYKSFKIYNNTTILRQEVDDFVQYMDIPSLVHDLVFCPESNVGIIIDMEESLGYPVEYDTTAFINSGLNFIYSPAFNLEVNNDIYVNVDYTVKSTPYITTDGKLNNPVSTLKSLADSLISTFFDYDGLHLSINNANLALLKGSEVNETKIFYEIDIPKGIIVANNKCKTNSKHQIGYIGVGYNKEFDMICVSNLCKNRLSVVNELDTLMTNSTKTKNVYIDLCNLDANPVCEFNDGYLSMNLPLSNTMINILKDETLFNDEWDTSNVDVNIIRSYIEIDGYNYGVAKSEVVSSVKSFKLSIEGRYPTNIRLYNIKVDEDKFKDNGYGIEVKFKSMVFVGSTTDVNVTNTYNTKSVDVYIDPAYNIWSSAIYNKYIHIMSIDFNSTKYSKFQSLLNIKPDLITTPGDVLYPVYVATYMLYIDIPATEIFRISNSGISNLSVNIDNISIGNFGGSVEYIDIANTWTDERDLGTMVQRLIVTTKLTNADYAILKTGIDSDNASISVTIKGLDAVIPADGRVRKVANNTIKLNPKMIQEM